MNDEAKDRLIAYINDNIRQAKMRRGFTGKRHLMAREDGYVEALQHVLQQLESLAVDPHSRYAKATRPACYRCGGTGSITYFGEGADEGHDIDANCPACNPKYPDYD